MNRSHFHRAVATTVALNLALIAGSASAQIERPGVETLQLTLEDAVRRAVEHNPDLAIVRLGTQVEAAHVGETRSAFTPMFSTLVGRSSSVTPSSNFLLGDRGVDVNDLFSSTSVRQRLSRGGGTWSLSWDSARTTTTSPLSSFAPSLESGFQIAFSQPLLKDRKMDAARQQYIIAKRNQESSELRFRESVVQTVASVKQAYWTLKALVANVTVQQRSLELAEELVRQNKVRVDVGQAPPLDLVQAEAEAAQRREAVILADTAAQDAEDRLRRLIMDPADTAFWQIRVNAIDEPAGPVPLPDVDETVTNAFQRALRSGARTHRAQQCEYERGVPQQPDAARCAIRGVIR